MNEQAPRRQNLTSEAQPGPHGFEPVEHEKTRGIVKNEFEVAGKPFVLAERPSTVLPSDTTEILRAEGFIQHGSDKRNWYVDKEYTQPGEKLSLRSLYESRGGKRGAALLYGVSDGSESRDEPILYLKNGDLFDLETIRKTGKIQALEASIKEETVTLGETSLKLDGKEYGPFERVWIRPVDSGPRKERDPRIATETTDPFLKADFLTTGPYRHGPLGSTVKRGDVAPLWRTEKFEPTQAFELLKPDKPKQNGSEEDGGTKISSIFVHSEKLRERYKKSLEKRLDKAERRASVLQFVGESILKESGYLKFDASHRPITLGERFAAFILSNLMHTRRRRQRLSGNISDPYLVEESGQTVRDFKTDEPKTDGEPPEKTLRRWEKRNNRRNKKAVERLDKKNGRRDKWFKRIVTAPQKRAQKLRDKKEAFEEEVDRLGNDHS